MQLTSKSLKTVDACRFCWMCRHICPIGNATGQERNTSRARALALSMVVRNVEPLDQMIDNVYECALCGACTKECLTGWDPTQFTSEAKFEAALEGCTPAHIAKLLDNIEQTGSVYGKKNRFFANSGDFVLGENKDALFFCGQDMLAQMPTDRFKNPVFLLANAGMEITALADEPSSGYDLFFLVGAAEETRQAAQKCAAVLNQFKTVVCYDPNDAKMFLRQYKEWGIELTAQIKTFPAVLADLVVSGKLTPKKSSETFTFQDPAALARDLEDTTSARTVLSACGELKEFLLHGKDTNLAGNLIMGQYMPEAMAQVARNRWRDAQGVGATTVVTASPAEYVSLKAVQPEGMNLLTLEEAVAKCL